MPSRWPYDHSWCVLTPSVKDCSKVSRREVMMSWLMLSWETIASLLSSAASGSQQIKGLCKNLHWLDDDIYVGTAVFRLQWVQQQSQSSWLLGPGKISPVVSILLIYYWYMLHQARSGQLMPCSGQDSWWRNENNAWLLIVKIFWLIKTFPQWRNSQSSKYWMFRNHEKYESCKHLETSDIKAIPFTNESKSRV